MTALTVYATARGRRYHATADCTALLSAQALNDWDPGWVPGCRALRTYAVVATTPQQATAEGQQPCLRCRPPLPPVVETHRHEPVEYDGVPICRRCATTVTRYDEAYRSSRWLLAVSWPCTSAVVLGLVGRVVSR